MNILIVKKDIFIYLDFYYCTNLLIIIWYQKLVEFQIYILIKIKFNITFVIFVISQFVNNLGFKFILVMKYIFWYFKQYFNFEIIYKKEKLLSIYNYVDLD